MPKKKVTISVDDKVYSNFQKYCEENAIMLSKKLELIMKAITKGKAKNLMIFLFIGLSLMSLIYAFAFSDTTQSNFNNGTYVNTTYNGSAVVLVGSNLSGTFTSRIFDSTTSSTRWDNLSSSKGLPTKDNLYSVDAQANVYSSQNLGVSWTFKSQYFSSFLADTQDIFSDTNNKLYIIKNSQREIYRSDDYGATWSLINNTFANKDLYTGASYSTAIYVFGATGSGWKSNDFGVTWTSLTDFNGAATNNPLGSSSNSSGGIYVVDSSGAVYASSDNGSTWGLKNSSYGRTTDTQKLFSDSSNNLYILTSTNKEVWKSTNNGISWNFVNNTFSNLALLSGFSDSLGNLYAISGTSAGKVYKSSNAGINWDLVNSSYNNGNGASRGLTYLTIRTNLSFQVKNCSLSDCSDGTWQNLNLNNINLTGRYFQYKLFFTSQESGLNPQLFNVSVGYFILDITPPNITINTPLNQTYNTNSILFNITAVDNTGISSCWYSLNSGANNNSMTNSGNFWTATNSTMSQDSQTARFYCNDSFNNLNNTGLRTFFIDSINPSVEISKNISQVELGGGSININWTATDTNINTVIFNITYPNGSLLYNSLFNAGSIDLSSSNNLSVLGVYTINLLVDDSIGNTNSTSSTFSVNDTLAPSLTIIHPEAKTYGINSSLPLNFSASDFGVGIDSCWYNLKNSSNNYIISNTTLTNCQNTTFDSDGDEIYTITIFSNDTLGNEGSNSVSFSVVTTAPAINLIAPANNSYLNSEGIIYFNYTVDSGFPISACQLWGDFSGAWQLNQTNLSTALSINNFFRVNLTEGNYNWGIVCNDTQNKKSSTNRTFSIDITSPSLAISQPIGTKTSRTGIPLTFSVGDASPVSCIYNVFTGASVVVSNTSVNCSSGSATFSVTSDADFILNFYVNDSAGNTKYSNSSFSVDTSTPSGGNTGGSSGGGGGGGGGGGSFPITPKVVSGLNKLEITGLSNLIVNPGDTKKLTPNVRNAGTNFLNNCKLKPIGEYSSWVSSEGTKNLAAGEISDFSFSLNIPKDVESGIFSITLSLECQETSKDTQFSVEVIKKRLGFDLVKVERFAEDKIKVNFFLEELSGVEQEVNIQFLFFGSDNKKVAEVEQSRTVLPNSKETYEIIIPIDSSLEGELNLLVNINSETYSTFVQENILLGSYVSGFSIFGGEKSRVDSIISLLLILLFSVFAYFIIKRILHHKKSFGYEIKRENKRKLKKKHGFFKKLYLKVFSKKDKRGVMLIDNQILELLKRESSRKDLKGKWIDLSVKK